MQTHINTSTIVLARTLAYVPAALLLLRPRTAASQIWQAHSAPVCVEGVGAHRNIVRTTGCVVVVGVGSTALGLSGLLLARTHSVQPTR